MLKRILFLFAIVFAVGPVVYGQITTSSMTGTVKDTSGQILAGASITAVHTPTGTKYATSSRSNGLFDIREMRTGGPYHIEISFVGFETLKLDDIYLRLAEPFYLPAIMQKAGTILSNVIVTGGRRNAILNSSRTGAVTNLGRGAIERMPTITRSVNDLTRATPQSNGSSIAGGNYRQNNFTIDGADFNNSFGIGSNLPAGGSPISLDAIDEISVNISPFDVRQSGFIGSAINAVTRSGTNVFQGSAYTFWRSEKQQGDKVAGTKFVRTPFEFKQYGVRLGGPIIKNKLFFFFNYETENQPKLVQTRSAATVAGTFGGNIARPTADSLDYMADYLRKTYGYDPGAYQGYSTEIERTKYLGRIDWNINQNHHLTIRYSQVEGGEPNPPSTSTSGSNFVNPSGYTNRNDINAMWFQNSNYFQGANFYSGALELTSKFGKRITNVFRATYTYQNDSRSTTSDFFPFVDILSDNKVYTSFGYEPFSYGNLRKVKMYSFVDNFTWTKGKHTVTAGLQADISETINGFQRFGASYYVFNTWNDFVSGANPSNFAITYSFLPGFAQAFPKFKFAQFSLYAQDEIVFSDKFRLTAGLRVDQPRYLDVEEVKTNPFVLARTFANGTKINTGVLPENKLMWSPRIGFNWDFYGDRSLQIRGGTGVFTGKVPFVWIVSQVGDAGMLQTTVGYNGTATTPGPFNPDPGAYRPNPANIPAPGSIIPTAISSMAPNYNFPQTWKSSLGIDKRLPWNMIFTLEAVFNKDLQTAVFNNVNLVNPVPLNIAGYPDNRLMYPNPTNLKYINPVQTTPATNSSIFVNNGTTAPAGSSIQAANVVQMQNGTKGYYFSLTAQLQKQWTRGLSASLAYTKSMSSMLFDGGGDQPLSAWQGTAISRGPNSPELSYAQFIVPDRLMANITYRKEYFKHLGTTISLFYNGASDGRFSYVYGADFNRDGQNGNDLIYIPKDPSEITFVDRPASAQTGGVAFTAAQQSALFFAYIEQDKYLRNHKGQYAERNGAQLPWRNQVDFRLMQDVFVNVGKHRNTIQFTIDIFNFGNLLNSNWSKVKSINAASILVPQNFATLTPGGTTRPTFWLNTDRNHIVTETFRDNVSITSTYYMQFGLRYIFGN